MTNERPEFRVLRPIPDPNNPSRSAYRDGEYIHAQVVTDWALVTGEDVEALALGSAEPPGKDAGRPEWATYALTQGADPAEVDDMSLADLRKQYSAEAEPASKTATKTKGAAPAKGA